MAASSDDLIPLKPYGGSDVVCAVCGHEQLSQGELFFQGIHTVARHTCSQCGQPFYTTIPVAHDLLFPATFGEQGTHLSCDPTVVGWMIGPLLESLFKGTSITVPITKKGTASAQEIIILNCLESIFGHAFAKLWNAVVLTKKYPGLHLIVFVPRTLAWLVPDDVPEVWIFDAPLKDLKRGIANLDAEVKQLMESASNVWLSRAYTHLPLETIDLRKLHRTEPFDLSRFTSQKPTITFIIRNDRPWQSTRLEYFLFLVATKFKLSKAFFAWRQNRLIGRTARKILLELPAAEFFAAGLGTAGRLPRTIRDRRKGTPTVADEMMWCQLYARSHIVIGVHGSGMLLPTSLAAGFIAIMPRHKIQHFAEDIAMVKPSRFMVFLGRHVDQYASPTLVSRHAIRMIRDFPYVYKNATQEV
ncbi:MAG: hypothetical protein LOY03_15030 [Cyclobacteriaceae bacterium]|nr:hypothetical protein [Cyclobacteriaceae bacterium]